MEWLINHYAHNAWANGNKAIQAGRWKYIEARLKELEADFQGITALVLAEVERLKRESRQG